jgi:transposase
MAHLEDVTADDLRRILAEVEGKRATQRVMIGLNYKSGLTQRRLAEMYGVTEKTIYNWLSRLDRLADEPVEEVVYDDDRPGRPSKLTDAEHERLEEVLLQSPTEVNYDAPAWTPALAQRYIAETFGPDYCLRQVRELMTQAGLSYKTVRSANNDADPRAQQAWQEGFEKRRTIWTTNTRS